MTAQCSAVTAKAVPAGDIVRPARVLPTSACVVVRGRRMGFHPVAAVTRYRAWSIA